MKQNSEIPETEQNSNKTQLSHLRVPLPIEHQGMSEDQHDALSAIVQTIVNLLLGLLFRKK